METNMKVSICVPAHKEMKNHDFFLARLKESVALQTLGDYELIITYEGKMAENTNAAMRKATGEYIKILYMDDYLTDKFSLEEMVRELKTSGKNWLASGCVHDDGLKNTLNPHYPKWSKDIRTGNNTIGSPSVIMLKNNLNVWFDEKMSYFLDCDFYHRLNEKYGAPALLKTFGVTIGVGDHQTSNRMSDREKLEEFNYLQTL